MLLIYYEPIAQGYLVLTDNNYPLLFKKFLFLAVRTKAVKIQPMTANPKPGFLHHFIFEFLKIKQRWIQYRPTIRTDHMRVRVRLVSVIPVAHFTEFQLKNFARLFKKTDRLIDSGRTHCWIVFSQLLVNTLRRRMISTMSKYFQNGVSLRCYTKLVLFEFLDHLFQSYFRRSLRVVHANTEIEIIC